MYSLRSVQGFSSFPDPLNCCLGIAKNAKLLPVRMLNLCRNRKKSGEGHFAIIFAKKVNPTEIYYDSKDVRSFFS